MAGTANVSTEHPHIDLPQTPPTTPPYQMLTLRDLGEAVIGLCFILIVTWLTIALGAIAFTGTH